MNRAILRDPRFVFGLLFAVLVIRPCCASDLAVTDAWVRATIGQASVTAGYATVSNRGEVDDRLLGVQAAGVAKTEIHRTTVGEGGVMRMRPVAAIDLPVGETVTLAQGKDHLMLTGVARPLKDGEEIQLTFTFETAGAVSTTALVARRNPFR